MRDETLASLHLQSDLVIGVAAGLHDLLRCRQALLAESLALALRHDLRGFAEKAAADASACLRTQVHDALDTIIFVDAFYSNVVCDQRPHLLLRQGTDERNGVSRGSLAFSAKVGGRSRSGVAADEVSAVVTDGRALEVSASAIGKALIHSSAHRARELVALRIGDARWEDHRRVELHRARQLIQLFG